MADFGRAGLNLAGQGIDVLGCRWFRYLGAGEWK